MVLGGRPPGRVGRRRIYRSNTPALCGGVRRFRPGCSAGGRSGRSRRGCWLSALAWTALCQRPTNPAAPTAPTVRAARRARVRRVGPVDPRRGRAPAATDLQVLAREVLGREHPVRVHRVAELPVVVLLVVGLLVAGLLVVALAEVKVRVALPVEPVGPVPLVPVHRVARRAAPAAPLVVRSTAGKGAGSDPLE